jgi:hypothetical protein
MKADTLNLGKEYLIRDRLRSTVWQSHLEFKFGAHSFNDAAGWLSRFSLYRNLNPSDDLFNCTHARFYRALRTTIAQNILIESGAAATNKEIDSSPDLLYELATAISLLAPDQDTAALHSDAAARKLATRLIAIDRILAWLYVIYAMSSAEWDAWEKFSDPERSKFDADLYIDAPLPSSRIPAELKHDHRRRDKRIYYELKELYGRLGECFDTDLVVYILSNIAIIIQEWNSDYTDWKSNQNRQVGHPKKSPKNASPISPQLTEPLPTGIAMVPSNEYYSALQRALAAADKPARWLKGKWLMDESNQFVFYHDEITKWCIGTKGQHAGTWPPMVPKYHEQLMDVIDIVCWQWFTAGCPYEIAVEDRDLARMRGISRLRSPSLRLQQEVMLSLEEIVLYHKRPAEDGPSALFSIRSMLSDSRIERCDLKIYYIQPGPVLRGDAGYGLDNTPVFASFFNPALWELHPDREKIAKRILRYLRQEYRSKLEEYGYEEGDHKKGDQEKGHPEWKPNYKPWEYHLKHAGISLHQCKKRPSEFIDGLHQTLYGLTGLDPNSSSAAHPFLRACKDDWEKGHQIKKSGKNVHVDIPIGWYDPDHAARVRNISGRGALGEFLKLEIHLPLHDSVFGPLRKIVGSRLKGKIHQQASLKRSTSKSPS